MLTLVAIYESQVIPKGIKTNNQLHTLNIESVSHSPRP